MNDDEIIARGGTQDDIDRYAESYGINTPQEDKELQHIEDLLVIYGNAPTGANRTRIMQLIKARDEQRERAIANLSVILDKYGTSKCDECHEYMHDDDTSFCERCPNAFHEGCAGYAYDGEGEYPSESAYALCTRCTNPQEQDKGFVCLEEDDYKECM